MPRPQVAKKRVRLTIPQRATRNEDSVRESSRRFRPHLLELHVHQPEHLHGSDLTIRIQSEQHLRAAQEVLIEGESIVVEMFQLARKSVPFPDERVSVLRNVDSSI